jgi:hypothetical protein
MDFRKVWDLLVGIYKTARIVGLGAKVERFKVGKSVDTRVKANFLHPVPETSLHRNRFEFDSIFGKDYFKYTPGRTENPLAEATRVGHPQAEVTVEVSRSSEPSSD